LKARSSPKPQGFSGFGEEGRGGEDLIAISRQYRSASGYILIIDIIYAFDMILWTIFLPERRAGNEPSVALSPGKDFPNHRVCSLYCPGNRIGYSPVIG
jgi:hypothetical protein